MTSAIDVTVPIYGNPTTKSVRDNFVAAHDEIGALQTDVATKVNKAGDTMLGFLELYLDPELPKQAATKNYVDASVAAAGGGASLTVADTPPAIANGKMWFDSASTQLYIGYDDGSSAQWVIATNPNVQQSSAALQPLYNNVGRNLIHNALFQIYQRGVGPFNTNGVFSADRWAIAFIGGTLSVNVNIALTDAARTQIGDEAARTCLGANFTGGSAAGDITYVYQKTESVRRLAGKTVTVSFWCNASATPKIGINILQDFGTGGSPSTGVWATAVAITASTTWTRYSATFTLASVAGKTLGSNNNDATTLVFWLSCGATNNANAGNIGVQSGIVNFWGIQLEIGSVATPLEKIDPRNDLANCQRFYSTGQLLYQAYAISGMNLGTTMPYPVTMRATPTLALGSNANGNIGTVTLTSLGAIHIWFSAASIVTGACTFNQSYTASADL